MTKLNRSAARISALGLAIVMATGGTVVADPVGTWRTQPDRKGQVANVRAAPCGAYICGTIVEVFDQRGNPVAAPTIGRQVFWNMTPDGSDYVGRAFVPAHNREYAGRLKVEGDRMTVKGCVGPICQSQVWTRVR